MATESLRWSLLEELCLRRDDVTSVLGLPPSDLSVHLYPPHNLLRPRPPGAEALRSRPRGPERVNTMQDPGYEFPRMRPYVRLRVPRAEARTAARVAARAEHLAPAGC